jgi:hypothetical protein
MRSNTLRDWLPTVTSASCQGKDAPGSRQPLLVLWSPYMNEEVVPVKLSVWVLLVGATVGQ